VHAQSAIVHSTEASGLADILERILDKGIVIAGDIQIKIADIELLTINIRLLVASVDKAKEMGINWWEGNPFLNAQARSREERKRTDEKQAEIEALQKRITMLEKSASAN
jgi:hypothetical protein